MWLNLDTASIPLDGSANTDVRLREQNSARTRRQQKDHGLGVPINTTPSSTFDKPEMFGSYSGNQQQ